MTIIELRKKGTAVGPATRLPDGEPHGVRVVADEGKVLQHIETEQQAPSVDLIDSADASLWIEVDKPADPVDPTEELQTAWNILTGEGGTDDE